MGGLSIVPKKLTLLLSDDVYDGLYRQVGPRRIGQFIEDLVRPHIVASDLDAAYAEMAADQEREAEALEWSEAFITDVADDAR
jgi:hypothetical protein